MTTLLNLSVAETKECKYLYSVGCATLCSKSEVTLFYLICGAGVVYYTRAQNVCTGWPVYEVKQPQEKWACDFHDDAPPLSFQLQVAEVIF